MRCTHSWLVVVCFFSLAAAAGRGQEAGSDRESAAEWLEARQAEFQQYEFTLPGEPAIKLAMELRSLLNWSNAEREADVGALFVWTHRGRPQMIACGYGRGTGVRHEFHSLSTQSIVAERAGDHVNRFKPGIEWHDLAGAPPPATTRPLRLAQMRRQAGRFRVTIGKMPTEMRLLTQPAFRSPADAEGDVTLFVFVQGTDPECVLSLEATADGKWRYGLTRQTKWPLQVELDGKLVAEFTTIGNIAKESESPFFVVTPPAADAAP